MSFLNAKQVFEKQFESTTKYFASPASKKSLASCALTLISYILIPIALMPINSSAETEIEKSSAEKQASKRPNRKKGIVDQVSGQGYGMAGCGLGSILFGERPGMVQIFAGTTNSIYSNNTFGVSSGTSNCSDDAQEMAALIFIETNRQSVESDVARGGGETLSAFYDIAGCHAKREEMSLILQKNYSGIFHSEATSSQVIKAIRETLSKVRTTSLSCQNLG